MYNKSCYKLAKWHIYSLWIWSKSQCFICSKKKNPNEEQEDIFMAIAQNIGYDTHTQRYIQIPENDLPLILNAYRTLKHYKGGCLLFLKAGL